MQPGRKQDPDQRKRDTGQTCEGHGGFLLAQVFIIQFAAHHEQKKNQADRTERFESTQ